ncbi:hypothetical protein ACWGOQ_0022480 [Aquimarina sp. M1]
MIKRIVIGIVAIVVGIGIALFADSFFREQIQNIFRWSTSNRIRFTGKNFHLFSTNFYYFSFGCAFLVFALGNSDKKRVEIIKKGLISILIFIISVIGISSIDANLRVIECTACNDGIRNISWNGIKYSLILGISILTSTIPSLISLIRKKNGVPNK